MTEDSSFDDDEPLGPPTIAEQIEEIEANIEALRGGHEGIDGVIREPEVIRSIECLHAAIASLKKLASGGPKNPYGSN